MPCTFSAMASESSPCASDVSSCPPTTMDGREVRRPDEVAVAPAAMGSVSLQAMFTLLFLVQSLFHLFQFVLAACIAASPGLLGPGLCRVGRHFHVIDHYCHCISFRVSRSALQRLCPHWRWRQNHR